MTYYLLALGFHPVVVTTLMMAFSFGWPVIATWAMVKIWERFDR